MKKTLIALAALATTTISFAQVTVYGGVDQGYFSEKSTSAAGVAGTVSGIRDVMGANLLGIKATESLGGGLTASVQMEYGSLVDSANTVGALNTNRNSFIELTGGFGGVQAGTVYTLIDSVQGAFDPNGNATSAGWLGGSTSRGRQNNAIQYTSPSMGGFSVQVQLGFGESAAPAAGGSSNANDATSFAVNYGAGPLAVMVATETVKSASMANSLMSAVVGSADTDATATSFGASYDLGAAKVMAVRTTAKAGTATPVEATTNNLGVSVPFGSMAFNASIGNGTVGNAGVNTDASAYQLGLTYSLSKRTSAYGLLGNTVAKTASATVVSDTKTETMSIGVRHTF